MGAGGCLALVQGKRQPRGIGKPVGTCTGGRVPAKEQLSPESGRFGPVNCLDRWDWLEWWGRWGLGWLGRPGPS
ncbi:voltage-dependent L-type calcium channel subunit alpha-1S [Streptomyces sp. NBRC 110611]|nr:voltage-dependent L-type calcium channel subunit alpha-1S [Streptomyces sp. NBRC 110611]